MEISLTGKISSLSLISQRKLENILLTCGDKKDLVIEPSLIDPLERVCAASWLRQRGVDKIYKLEAKMNSPITTHRIYMISSCLIRFKYVLDHINSMITQKPLEVGLIITIIIIPKLLAVHETLLEEEGLSDIVNLKSYQWELILMDENVMSLEYPLFKMVFVNKDVSLLNSVANSLWTLFQVIGKPSLFVSVGKQSHSILEMYNILHQTFDKKNHFKIDNEIGALLIVDRDQDYVSGLLTPATYSGLLYEIFYTKCGKLDLDVNNTKIKNGHIDLSIPFEKVDNKNVNKTSVLLEGESDAVYSEIRYRHFSTVFSILNAKVKALNTEGGTIGDLGINQMKQYVSTKLQQILATKRSLANHVLACETIVGSLGDKFEDIQVTEGSMLYNKNKKSNYSYIDSYFSTDANMFSCLRLLCILTLTQGVTYEEYNSLVTKYLHAFGYKYLYIFQNLVSAGLVMAPLNTKIQLGIPNLATISERLPKWQNNFQTAANKLKQLPRESENLTMNDPSCPSYVFSGSYIPFIAAVSNILLTTENTTDLITKLTLINDIKLGGSIFDNDKQVSDDLEDKISQMNVDSNTNSSDIDIGCKDIKNASNFLKSDNAKYAAMPLRPKTLLVFVVGGVTQAELASCNLVGKLTGGKIIVASDSLITGENLVQATI